MTETPKTAKHTPGPWSVEDPMGADIGLWIVQDGLPVSRWSCIAMVSQDDEDTRYPETRFITSEEQSANARLIAEAPALLEALFRLKTEAEIDGMDKRPGWDAWVSLANEVIARATSSEPSA